MKGWWILSFNTLFCLCFFVYSRPTRPVHVILNLKQWIYVYTFNSIFIILFSFANRGCISPDHGLYSLLFFISVHFIFIFEIERIMRKVKIILIVRHMLPHFKGYFQTRCSHQISRVVFFAARIRKQSIFPVQFSGFLFSTLKIQILNMVQKAFNEKWTTLGFYYLFCSSSSSCSSLSLSSSSFSSSRFPILSILYADIPIFFIHKLSYKAGKLRLWSEIGKHEKCLLQFILFTVFYYRYSFVLLKLTLNSMNRRNHINMMTIAWNWMAELKNCNCNNIPWNSHVYPLADDSRWGCLNL